MSASSFAGTAASAKADNGIHICCKCSRSVAIIGLKRPGRIALGKWCYGSKACLGQFWHQVAPSMGSSWSRSLIKSALIKRSVLASAGKKLRAKVVLPAPLGPAMMIFFKFSLCFSDFMLCRATCQPNNMAAFIFLVGVTKTIAKVSGKRIIRTWN